MLATRLPTAPRRETHAAGAASRKAGARLRGSRWRPRPLPRLENTSHGPALGSGLGDVALGKARVCPNSEQKQRWCLCSALPGWAAVSGRASALVPGLVGTLVPGSFWDSDFMDKTLLSFKGCN